MAAAVSGKSNRAARGDSRRSFAVGRGQPVLAVRSVAIGTVSEARGGCHPGRAARVLAQCQPEAPA